MKKISIVVPVFNAEKYLKKCIESLLNQSLKDIEIIILNDGSTDDSHSIISNYKDKRIIYINKDNEGISVTRNKGIEISSGKYIAFVDSDDYVDSKFCEKMYYKAEQENCDIVICDYFNCVNNVQHLISLVDFENTSLKEQPNIINEINLGPCNKIYSSKLIKDNNILFPINLKYEDVPFVCESLVKAEKIGKVNEGLSYFNVRQGSQTTIRDEKIFDVFAITDLVSNILDKQIKVDTINYLIISIIINYLIQSRYIKSKNVRKLFINYCYEYLDYKINDWKNYCYFENLSILKRLIIKNKLLLKIYIFVYINCN